MMYNWRYVRECCAMGGVLRKCCVMGCIWKECCVMENL